MKNLKKALFGYSRRDVCEYIAQLNDTFTKKLHTCEEEQKDVVCKLENRINELEAENKSLTERRDAISQAIVEAKLFSAQLEAKAQEEQNLEINKTRQYYQNARERVDSINVDVTDLQRALCSSIEHLKADLEQASCQYNKIHQQLETEFNSLQKPD